jgi:next-to-BRCA1 protein 1
MPHPIPIASCDFCDSVINGTRYKCKDCPDFDLCERCIALADTQHPGHTFEVSRTHRTRCTAPHPPTPVTENSTNYHAGVRCDGCDKWIYGVRYKVNHFSFTLCWYNGMNWNEMKNAI